MQLKVQFVFTSGTTFNSETHEFDSIEAVLRRFTTAINHSGSTITWHSSDDEVRLFNAANIETITVTPARRSDDEPTSPL